MNSQNIKDLRNYFCPIPVIETKKIIQNEANKGQKFVVLLGTENSKDNVMRMLENLKTNYQISEKEDYFELSFTV